MMTSYWRCWTGRVEAFFLAGGLHSLEVFIWQASVGSRSQLSVFWNALLGDADNGPDIAIITASLHIPRTGGSSGQSCILRVSVSGEIVLR